jgi:hypothetical protein
MCTPQLPYAQRVVASMSMEGWASATRVAGRREMNARYDFLWAPFGGGEDGSIVRPPHGQRALCVEPPVHQPAVRVARQQARVAAQKLDAVDVGRVAAEDVAGLGGLAGRLAVVDDVNRHATGVLQACYGRSVGSMLSTGEHQGRLGRSTPGLAVPSRVRLPCSRRR